MYQIVFSIAKKVAGKYWYFVVIFALLAFISIMKFQNSKIQAELKAIQKEFQIKSFEAESAQKSLNDMIQRRELENKVLTDLDKETHALQAEIQKAKDSYNEKSDIVSNFRAIVDRLHWQTNDTNP